MRFSSRRASQHSIMMDFDQTRARSNALNETSWMMQDKWVICVFFDLSHSFIDSIQTHWQTIKRIFRYLRETYQIKLMFQKIVKTLERIYKLRLNRRSEYQTIHIELRFQYKQRDYQLILKTTIKWFYSFAKSNTSIKFRLSRKLYDYEIFWFNWFAISIILKQW
jgi:hypothetical protein